MSSKSSQIDALKKTVKNIHSTMDQVAGFVKTAEEQLDELQKSHKREGDKAGSGPPASKKAKTSDSGRIENIN